MARADARETRAGGRCAVDTINSRKDRAKPQIRLFNLNLQIPRSAVSVPWYRRGSVLTHEQHQLHDSSALPASSVLFRLTQPAQYVKKVS